MSAYPGAPPHPPPPPQQHSAYPGSAGGVPPPGAGGPPPPPGAGGPPGVAAIPDSYFTESRKGEINELRNLLRGFATERDIQRKRDIMKKVIAYMTLGIDVSRLFSEMMLAIETRDLVIKKMVYLYLTNYARTHPELAQMCTNTLQKDCGNEDPMVRGLALRALCGLNLPQMVEYISEPLRRSLSDGHPYVRKTGVMGLLKLYHLDPTAFGGEDGSNSGFVDLLYDMLRDPDASVVANCIIVLNEIMQKAGGMAINRAIMLHLLNRIREFNEFAVVQVLELVPRYIPANEEEGFQIMNLLDPVLRTASATAVMATIRAFLSLADQLGEDSVAMKRQIVQRVKAPLVTLISSGSSEHMYALLKHVDALTDISPGVFDDEYKQFYIRYNEPTYVKYLKIQILPNLANPDTAPDIVTELAAIVSDGNGTNTKLSRTAVRSMARIGCSNRGGPGAAEAIARRLVEMLDWSSSDHISSEAAVALTLMIRKHPASLKTLVAPPLVRSLKYVTEPTGKAAVVYLLGECGDSVQQAPYALERLIDRYDDLDDAAVKNALLSSTMKLFFRRPPECQRMLGRLLSRACDDVSSQDLHDRALLYYRMLKASSAEGGNLVPADTLRRVVDTNTAVAVDGHFSEDDDDELRAALLREYNTLSTVFGKTAETFIAPEFIVPFVKQPVEHPLQPGVPAAAASTTATAATNDISGGNLPASAGEPSAAAPAAAAAAQEEVADLLGFGAPAPAPAPAAPPPAAAAAGTGGSSVLRLSPSCSMSGDEYQNRWGSVADSDAVVSAVPLPSLPAGTDAIEQKLAAVHCHTMASGALPNELKFFLYGQQQQQQHDTGGDATGGGALFLIQANVDTVAGASDPMMIVTVKVLAAAGMLSDNNALAQQLIELMTKALN